MSCSMKSSDEDGNGNNLELRQYVGTTPLEILALDNSIETELHGGMVFFIGSFETDNEIWFYAYLKNQNGAIKLYKFISGRTTIYEDIKADEKPFAYVGISCPDELSNAEFHVPPDTIFRTIELNVKNLKGEN